MARPVPSGPLTGFDPAPGALQPAAGGVSPVRPMTRGRGRRAGGPLVFPDAPIGGWLSEDLDSTVCTKPALRPVHPRCSHKLLVCGADAQLFPGHHSHTHTQSERPLPLLRTPTYRTGARHFTRKSLMLLYFPARAVMNDSMITRLVCTPLWRWGRGAQTQCLISYFHPFLSSMPRHSKHFPASRFTASYSLNQPVFSSHWCVTDSGTLKSEAHMVTGSS